MCSLPATLIFNHARILELSNRPFTTIEDHDDALVENWNAVVGEDDIVYHLGDVALGKWPIGINRVGELNGYKTLIPGNHDRIASFEKRARRERFIPDYLNVFNSIQDEVFRVLIAGNPVVLSHYPYEGDSHDKERFTEIRPKDQGAVLIHGHTHCGPDDFITYSSKGTLQINVGVDAHSYRPVSIDKIIEIIGDCA